MSRAATPSWVLNTRWPSLSQACPHEKLERLKRQGLWPTRLCNYFVLFLTRAQPKMVENRKGFGDNSTKPLPRCTPGWGDLCALTPMKRELARLAFSLHTYCSPADR